MNATENAERQVEQAAREAAPWVERFTRFGYVAKGAVYMIIGLLTAQAALNSGNGAPSSQSVLTALLGRPLGQVLLAVLALGLFGYAFWRFVQAFADPENRGWGLKATAKRIGCLFSGVAYGALAVTAIQLILGVGVGSGNSEELWATRALMLPFGRWVLVLGALVAFGVALNALYVAFTAMFKDKLDLRDMSDAQQRWTILAGSAGLAARGAILGVVGILMMQAAVQLDPNEVGGLEEALQTISRQPFGPWLLGGVATGLFAYGAYAVAQARYRRIPL